MHFPLPLVACVFSLSAVSFPYSFRGAKRLIFFSFFVDFYQWDADRRRIRPPMKNRGVFTPLPVAAVFTDYFTYGLYSMAPVSWLREKCFT